uniref:LRRcap domain-containing protein n=1 Tax=Globodera pallida TaxID=36090 RepID=A0A183BVL0_GLOPA
MDERIKTELRGRQPSEVQDLLLDNCKATTICGLTEQFTNLTTLSLINVGLNSLDGLPKLPTVRTIDLSDNKLSGGLEKLVECCPRLYHINLCANKIATMETLAPLSKLEELAALDLFDCAITESPEYRTKVFGLIPQLKYLDGFDINDEISDEEEEEGAEDALDDEEDSAEEGVDSEEDAELAYLNSSKALQDEDDSEDYVEQQKKQKDAAKVATNGSENVTANKNAGENNRKRKHGNEEGEAAEDEPGAKLAQ